MTEHVPLFIIAVILITFMLGFGYMITQDENRRLIFKQQCIESGMQYANGSCLK